jgi:hypothetical protein
LKWQSSTDEGRATSVVADAPLQTADGTMVDYGLGTRLGLLEGHRVLVTLEAAAGLRPPNRFPTIT